MLNPILEELMNETEPYLVYLRGLVHMRLDQREEAIRCFVQSVKEKQYNWSCWSQLAQLVDSADKVGEDHLH
jgi:anaphase-promoting complex subunit 8